MDSINWLSMLLATLTPLSIGYVYYHKAVFGKAWMDSINLTDQEFRKMNLIMTLLVCLVLSFFLAFFLLVFNNDGINQEGDFDTFLHGAWHGSFIAITVVVPVIVLNGFFGKNSWKNLLINILYWLVTLPLMGGILDAMNHWENIELPGGF